MTSAELIDASELLEHLEACLQNGRPLSNLYELSEIVRYVKSMPTVDAVQVARCRECKHHTYEEPGMVYCPVIVGSWVSENWYCADGEREVQE